MLENKTILVLLNGAMSKKQDLKISWGGVNHPPPPLDPEYCSTI